jgi:hypothetical protein
MKKLILIFALLLAALVSFGQTIETSGIFETGYEEKRALIYMNEVPTAGVKIKPFFGYLYFDAQWKNIKAYTSNKTYFDKGDKIYFNPLQSEFKIGLSYEYKKILLGAEHMCSHSIDELILNEGYNKIFVRVKMF